MATHSSILAWIIPQTEEPGGLQPMVSQRVWHDWRGWTDYEDLSFNSYIIPTSELKPGELQLLEIDNQVVLPIEIAISMGNTHRLTLTHTNTH